MLKLIKRLMPDKADAFSWEIVPELAGFEIESKNGKIHLAGKDMSALTTALGHYLRYVAKVDIAWQGDGWEHLPEEMPLPAEKIVRAIPEKYRPAFNYCTFSYTMPWWSWERWEKELDYMALNGINLPLMTVGLEGVWYKTLTEDFGFTDEEARAFLCGPAFLAWQWLTNIESFGGPLPKSWIDEHVVLGQKIVARMRELGMTPILQGPSGLCPVAFKEKFPEANIRFKPTWNAIGRTAEIDPVDPLFARLGAAFLKNEKELFGVSGFYASDPFHEGEPPIDTPKYLNAVGEGIKNILEKHDVNYTWVLQSWSLRRDIISVVPKERILILDLRFRDFTNFHSFWGYPFVTGTLNNFGGNVNAHGDLGRQANSLFVEATSGSGNCVGVGVFMEGIERSIPYYELAYDMLTRGEGVNLDEWLAEYCLRRYGEAKPEYVAAWKLFSESIYGPGTDGTEKSSIACCRPAVRPKKSGPAAGLEIPYDQEKFIQGVKLLISQPSERKGYHADVLDLMRQVLTNRAQMFYPAIPEAFEKRDWTAFDEATKKFLSMLDDMDRLLYLSPSLRLDVWVNDARACGHTEEEKALYEWNARNQVTLWGYEEENTLFDYAWKEWAGLISDFYMKRWEDFFRMLRENPDYSDEGLELIQGREIWRANAYYSERTAWEAAWTRKTELPAWRDTEPQFLYEMAEKYIGK